MGPVTGFGCDFYPDKNVHLTFLLYILLISIGILGFPVLSRLCMANIGEAEQVKMEGAPKLPM